VLKKSKEREEDNVFIHKNFELVIRLSTLRHNSVQATAQGDRSAKLLQETTPT